MLIALLAWPAISSASIANAISAGGLHSCALVAGGGIECWGNAIQGQLGDGSVLPGMRSDVPVSVVGLTDATQVSAGGLHTCAVLAGGQATCWGSNRDGQLGDGTTTNRNVPAPVTGITSATQISTGSGHSCALLTDGSINCWGAGGHGQLGNNQFVLNSTVPVPVSGIATATQIAASDDLIFAQGGDYACALLGSGQIKCWGSNQGGTLGDGSFSNSSSPVAVSGISSATQISAGGGHSCAVVAGGHIECWGNNGAGELGNGTNTSAGGIPVMVIGISNAVQVSAGGLHSCAVLSDGQIDCWGRNATGQLGDGSTTGSTTPVRVIGITNATQVSAGGEHTCALLSDGQIDCWGAHGSLGNGTSDQSSVPVPVGGIRGALTTADPGPTPTPTPDPRVPVVLVPGLGESTGAVAPGDQAGCGPAGSFQPMCNALATAGYPVYVVSSSAGRHGTVLDNQGRLNDNASRLALYLLSKLGGRRPLLVGHSMGGLISRIAIARYSAHAAGLFTIGTPHDGSFAADLIEGGLSVECGLIPDVTARAFCRGLRATLATIEFANGAPALRDMTFWARAADALAPPGIPVWTYAGTAVSGVDDGYWLPNDVVVTRSSAWGRHANLGPTKPYEAPLWHIRVPSALPGTIGLLLLRTTPSPDANEFDDPLVTARVLGAANGLSFPATTRAVTTSRSAVVGARAAAAAPTQEGRKRAPTASRVVTVSLLALGSSKVDPKRDGNLADIDTAIAAEPFGAGCGQRRIPAVPLGDGLYGLAPNRLGCGRPTLLGRAPLRLLTGDDRAHIRGSVRWRSRQLLVDVRGPGHISGAYVRQGVRQVMARRRGARLLIRTTRIRAGRPATLVAVVAGRRMVAPLPASPFA